MTFFLPIRGKVFSNFVNFAVHEIAMKEKEEATQTSTSQEVYHIPALCVPTIEALAIKPDGVYADATFGGGGHSRAIMEHLDAEGRLYGFDQDLDAKANALDDARFTFVHGNFRYMENFLRYYGEGEIDGIIADLGVSFHHFDAADRGFSFRAEAPLDMRMNRRGQRSAADIINEYSQEQLASLFNRFTDLKRCGAIASAIVTARTKQPIQTTSQLTEVVSRLLNPKKEKKDLAQVFQALRIETNHEMEALEQFLLSTLRILKPGGRLAILTYHSIEDRMVKNFFRSGNFGGDVEKDFFGKSLTPWEPVIRGALAPDEEEIERNPRARSAKLRAAMKIDNKK
jgi:16S rRNA (cytosine1402-N4)-methyltransferase